MKKIDKIASALLITALSASAAVSAQQVYRWMDKDGGVVFSDQPREGAETVKIKETTTVTLPKPDEVDKMIEKNIHQSDSAATDGNFRYDTLTILSPANDSAFHAGSGTVTIKGQITPPLRSQHRVRVLLDGKAAGEPNRSGSFTLMNVDRGTHSLMLEVIDRKDQSIQKGELTTFTVHRPTVRKSTAP